MKGTSFSHCQSPNDVIFDRNVDELCFFVFVIRNHLLSKRNNQTRRTSKALYTHQVQRPRVVCMPECTRLNWWERDETGLHQRKMFSMFKYSCLGSTSDDAAEASPNRKIAPCIRLTCENSQQSSRKALASHANVINIRDALAKYTPEKASRHRKFLFSFSFGAESERSMRVAFSILL